MACYFDEHDCAPLGEGEQPNHFLHLARLLADMGLTPEFEGMFLRDKPAPPASKEVVKSLPTVQLSATEIGYKCPVCLAPCTEGDPLRVLPCQHKFHPGCILPWLKKTNSCPVCRHELPTDDQQYEDYKKHKAREEQRKHDLEELHNSMYG